MCSSPLREVGDVTEQPMSASPQATRIFSPELCAQHGGCGSRRMPRREPGDALPQRKAWQANVNTGRASERTCQKRPRPRVGADRTIGQRNASIPKRILITDPNVEKIIVTRRSDLEINFLAGAIYRGPHVLHFLFTQI